MTTYADSSALIALYVNEAYSAEARRRIRVVAQVPFTALHDLEVRNALEALRGRRRITAKQLRALREHLEADLRAHRLCCVTSHEHDPAILASMTQVRRGRTRS